MKIRIGFVSNSSSSSFCYSPIRHICRKSVQLNLEAVEEDITLYDMPFFPMDETVSKVENELGEFLSRLKENEICFKLI